jgi:hypothetical protein
MPFTYSNCAHRHVRPWTWESFWFAIATTESCPPIHERSRPASLPWKSLSRTRTCAVAMPSWNIRNQWFIVDAANDMASMCHSWALELLAWPFQHISAFEE